MEKLKGLLIKELLKKFHKLEPPDKVKAVKEIIVGMTLFATDTKGNITILNLEDLATQICQLFEIKLPENPHWGHHAEGKKLVKHSTTSSIVWDEALQQVRETLEEQGVEVEG